ncbi:GNAT family N-acetyltransferase [Candidatus Woesebacteria bacterium]|nr:GNAT family N-acetyltransferase [Candidatus Woesebacteria bacterium]
MIIREVTTSDVPALTKVAQESYIDAFGDTLTNEDLQDVLKSRSEDYFYSVLSTDTILVALEETTLVGFIQFGKVSYDSIQPNEYDIELKKIFIDTAHHRKGIGKQLMDAMFSHRLLVKTQCVYLDVYAKNIKAISLYKKYGFSVIGKVPYKANGKIISHDLLMQRVTNN